MATDRYLRVAQLHDIVGSLQLIVETHIYPLGEAIEILDDPQSPEDSRAAATRWADAIRGPLKEHLAELLAELDYIPSN
jgi:hypothetical protein